MSEERTGNAHTILSDHGRLVTDVDALRSQLLELRFPFELATAAHARSEATSIGTQLADHVLPRLRNLDAPALVVVGGSTGSGKSLLVSSIVGSRVSASGVIRPTTRSPVLVHHPEDEQWFGDARILPGLARVRDHRSEAGRGLADDDPRRELRLIASSTLPAGIALLDAPDIDSIDAVNRDLAAQLLAAADVWVFVTTAARYADAVPWQFLETARRRGAPLVLVLNRVPPGAVQEVRTDLERLLGRNGLPGTQIFTIEEVVLGDDELLDDAVAPLCSWLTGLGADSERRAQTVRRSLVGVMGDVSQRTAHIVAASEEQQAVLVGLQNDAERSFAAAMQIVTDEVKDGSLIRGEVLARWEEFVGTGELLRQLRTGVGRIRSRIGSLITGRPVSQEQLNEAVEGVLQRLIVTQADEAAATTLKEWKNSGVGAWVTSNVAPSLGRRSDQLAADVESLVRDWQGDLLGVVRDQGASKRMTARVMSLGVNGVSAVLMMLVFSHTGGLSGGEVAIAGGASAVGHALLEALLGDDTLRRLAVDARHDLLERVAALLDRERGRFESVLDATGVADDSIIAVRATIERIDEGMAPLRGALR